MYVHTYASMHVATIKVTYSQPSEVGEIHAW